MRTSVLVKVCPLVKIKLSAVACNRRKVTLLLSSLARVLLPLAVVEPVDEVRLPGWLLPAALVAPEAVVSVMARSGRSEEVLYTGGIGTQTASDCRAGSQRNQPVRCHARVNGATSVTLSIEACKLVRYTVRGFCSGRILYLSELPVWGAVLLVPSTPWFEDMATVRRRPEVRPSTCRLRAAPWVSRSDGIDTQIRSSAHAHCDPVGGLALLVAEVYSAAEAFLCITTSG